MTLKLSSISPREQNKINELKVSEGIGSWEVVVARDVPKHWAPQIEAFCFGKTQQNVAEKATAPAPRQPQSAERATAPAPRQPQPAEKAIAPAPRQPQPAEKARIPVASQTPAAVRANATIFLESLALESQGPIDAFMSYAGSWVTYLIGGKSSQPTPAQEERRGLKRTRDEEDPSELDGEPMQKRTKPNGKQR
ncbi:MAG: hypothetical protein ACHQJ6_02245 [Candidatus Berkiellales bacterium]